MRYHKVIVTTAIGALMSTAAAADVLKIGASLPITGGFSIAGQKHKQGYELCVDMINERGGILGREVELIVSDNRSDPATAINQYERFINVDGVEAVYGTFSSRLTFPVASILAKNGFVHPIPAGGALRIYTQGHDNLFYFQPNAAEYVGASLKGIIEDLVPEGEGPMTAAVVSADDFFANAVEAGFLGHEVTNPADGSVVADLAPGYLEGSGIEVTFTEKWPEEGFSDWLNLANSIKRSGAELIIGLTASAEEAVQLTRALKTVRAEPKMVYFSQGTQAEFLEGTGESSDGVLVHTSWHADAPFQSTLGGEEFSNQDFGAAFEAAYGAAPDEDSAIPFAVCQGIEQAIVGAGSTDNAAMGAWLSDRSKDAPVRTILGRFAWDDVGLPVDKPFLMTQWNGGELQFVYPTDEFEGVQEMSYPKGGF
ncbi:amino acid ABC transporter substrate-binding protein [Poseidonocella sedimentorum]|uniref:Amino acid/amide ABC transporter substrate-binding protein, HAAT family n=1 Tax=Poseidonocella sedimentorum TaxID=871652 RepID=A0A1I6CS53_9RHOB|nr:amino acid ABC transporter substrate-binding protein [Poseidonocella sedimentorum]SFQ95951.1 amino acid/amide ABC transporter substrate-binding protein, HAAT family [Poseidonocella sedimentorum]